MQSSEPPPEFGAPTTVTCAVDVADLMPDEQLKVYATVPAALGVTVAVPSEGREPSHPSPGCPPLAVQPAAFDDVHVRTTGCPTFTAPGAADSVSAGTVSATVTLPLAETPFSEQVTP